MPDVTYSTLDNIRTKVRKLTASPSANQISDLQLDNYINTFVLYGFPEALRLYSLRKTLSFYTQPYIDSYTTNTINPDDPLYNFKNKYTSVHPPVYIGGFQGLWSQSREQFYGIYPKLVNCASVGLTGDGVTTNFTGVISNVPALQRSVLFNSIDLNNYALALIDVPISTNWANLYSPDDMATIRGTFNYLTGAFVLNFPFAPGAGMAINSQTFAYQPARPSAVLYFDDTFILRPVPDQVYRIDIEVNVRPSEFLATNQMPELSDWWEYIAYGAAKKVFEDRRDPESIQIIMPAFKEQESLILSRTVSQYSNDRVGTIYTEQIGIGTAGSSYGWGAGSI
jgi:hypothetical protein